MFDYRPYVKLYQLSRKYLKELDKLNGKQDVGFWEKINSDFNNLFWHKYKHLYMDLNPIIVTDINNIFNSIEVKNGNIGNLKASLKKAEEDSKNELPNYLAPEILEEIVT